MPPSQLWTLSPLRRSPNEAAPIVRGPIGASLPRRGAFLSIVAFGREGSRHADPSIMKIRNVFHDVKSRLLALFAMIIVPVAIVTIALAAANDRSLSSSIDRQWRQTTGEYAVRTRIWAETAMRTLASSAASAESVRNDESLCGAMLHDVVAANDGYKAIRIDFDDGRICAGAEDDYLGAAAYAISGKLRSSPRIALSPDARLAAEMFPVRDSSLLAIQVDAPATTRQKWTATALIDPTVLTRIFALGPNGRDIVALMQRGQKIVAASGAIPSDSNWLPATEAIGPQYSVATASSRNGTTFSYATQPALGSDFYILSRFDSSARRMARLRFLVLALAPLIMLAALYLAYSRAIRSELLRWFEAIKKAMLARKSGIGAPAAPEDADMPDELRDLAEAFNEMARESAAREQSLKASLAENEFLLWELNHRVKTSLQIIQSYLSLTRRFDSGAADQSAVIALEARVQVLSIAYRKALAQGRMRDIAIREFAVQIVDSLSQSFQRPGLALELTADVRAALNIDRAIPLGLALVESVTAGVEAEQAHVVDVRIEELNDMRVELRVSTDGVLAGHKPNPRLMAGLASQLDASMEPPAAGAIIRWRFQGGPPLVLTSNFETAQFVSV